ncbi:MAG TPA: DUF1365 domain-containing protein [Baekduia sp.]|nr:DUF1365 domain-containing protein [Baekduia sp.]
MTASALYAGEVRHRRRDAPATTFVHPVTYALLDLDELPTLLGGRLVRRRPGLLRVRRRDLYGDGDPRDAIRRLIAERTGRPAPRGPIRVLTMPRTFGVGFNPVSFVYAFDEDERLDAVVAEVTNTPWGQRHAYVLRPDDPDDLVKHGQHDKVLHVSPFQDMDRRYAWSVTAPGQTLSVHIASRRTGETRDAFDATLRLHRRPLDHAALLRAGGPARALALIYGHAAALKLRGAAHFPPPTTATR